MQFMGNKRQIWKIFTFRRYHRILHTCQELNRKEKKYIYSTFLGTTSSYGCLSKLKKKKQWIFVSTDISPDKKEKKRKILQRIPVMYYENIVKETDVNVSIYVNKHACIWKPWPFHL